MIRLYEVAFYLVILHIKANHGMPSAILLPHDKLSDIDLYPKKFQLLQMMLMAYTNVNKQTTYNKLPWSPYSSQIN